VNERDLDIFQIGDTDDILSMTQRVQQGTMDGGKDSGTFYGSADNSTMREVLGEFTLTRNEDIGMQQHSFLPRITDVHLRITLMLDDRE
jgi:hypothetical protein